MTKLMSAPSYSIRCVRRPQSSRRSGDDERASLAHDRRSGWRTPISAGQVPPRDRADGIGAAGEGGELLEVVLGCCLVAAARPPSRLQGVEAARFLLDHRFECRERASLMPDVLKALATRLLCRVPPRGRQAAQRHEAGSHPIGNGPPRITEMMTASTRRTSPAHAVDGPAVAAQGPPLRQSTRITRPPQ